MTLSDIRGWVRDKLQDTGFSATTIDFATNSFVFDLLTTTRTRMMETSDQLYASAGDTELELPDDYLVYIKEGFYCTSPQVTYMDDNYLEYGTFMRKYPDFATATANDVFAWTLFGNKIRFAAPLAHDAVFSVDYVQRPEAMEADDDECVIPDMYMELVTLGSLKRCMDVNEDYGESSQELANLEPLRTTFIRNEGRGGAKTGPTIMRPTTQRTARSGMGLRTPGDD